MKTISRLMLLWLIAVVFISMKTISRLMLLWLIAVVCCACHKDTPRRVCSVLRLSVGRGC